MTYRPRDVILGLLAGFSLLAGLVLGAWALIGPEAVKSPGDLPRQPLSQLQRQVAILAKAGQFDDAQAEVAAYLKHEPESIVARLMLAELALDRKDPQPELALETLRPVRPTESKLAAQVRLDQGKAYFLSLRYAEAEEAWKDALRIDPTIPEAGWALLDLYYVQGRGAEARRLALSLSEVEPDPHDRAQLLLELVRQDAQPVDPASVVEKLEPVIKKDPQDLHSLLALGLALVRDNRADQGIEMLRRAVASHPDDADAWDALLTGLGHAGRSADLAQALDRLPRALAESARFAEHRGRVAWDRRDWKEAAAAYRRAHEAKPEDHEVLYRLGQSLRSAGDLAAATEVERRARAFETAREAVGALYEEANANPTLGTAANPELYLRLADSRERMGRPAEALAWHRTNLRTAPDDPDSLAAVKRLAPGTVDLPTAPKT